MTQASYADRTSPMISRGPSAQPNTAPALPSIDQQLQQIGSALFETLGELRTIGDNVFGAEPQAGNGLGKPPDHNVSAVEKVNLTISALRFASGELAAQVKRFHQLV